MMRCLVFLCLFAFLASPSMAQSKDAPPAKRDQIRTLLTQIKLGEQGVQVARTILDKTEGASANLPPGFKEKFYEELTPQRFVEAMIPVWEKLFTEAEVKALSEFAKTPEGMSFFSKQSHLNEESMKAGQLLGMEIALKVVQQLQSETR